MNIAIAGHLKLEMRRQTRKGYAVANGVVIAYKAHDTDGWYWWKPIPNYHGDLNAIQTVVKSSPFSTRHFFVEELQKVASKGLTGGSMDKSWLLFCGPEQWTEAFIRVIGRWIEPASPTAP